MFNPFKTKPYSYDLYVGSKRIGEIALAPTKKTIWRASAPQLILTGIGLVGYVLFAALEYGADEELRAAWDKMNNTPSAE